MSGALIRIKEKVYPMPESERLGELRLIERVLGITHREFRVRSLDQQERLEAIDETEEITVRQLRAALDDLILTARIAQAIQRANPTWTTERVAQFVDALDDGDVVLEVGQEDGDDSPPANGAQDAPSNSENGSASVPPSNSASGTDSSESPTQVISGPATSPMSPGELSAPTT